MYLFISAPPLSLGGSEIMNAFILKGRVVNRVRKQGQTFISSSVNTEWNLPHTTRKL